MDNMATHTSRSGQIWVSMDSVVRELQCPICLELYNVPIILPCSHILCRSPCAERLFTNNFVRCPVCRDNCFVHGGVTSLPRVISLENIIDRYNNPDVTDLPDDEVEEEEENIEDDTPAIPPCGPNDIPCQLCDDTPYKAIKSCLDCNASYCEKCLKISHPKREPFISHQLINPRKYPKPKDVLCPLHEVKVNIYCQDCQQLACLLCSDDSKGHPGHRVMALDQARILYKELLEDDLRRLECGIEAVVEAIREHQDRKHAFQTDCQDRRLVFTEQCEAMVAEIEAKKDFFVSDLDYEEKVKTDTLTQHIGVYEKQAAALQSVIHFTQQVLAESDAGAFLQLAKRVSDRSKECLSALSDTSPLSSTLTQLCHKVVDLRKERAIIRDITYLAVPCTPVIAVEKCTRSTSSVVIVLSPPCKLEDIIDEYRVFYWSEEDKASGRQGTMMFKTPGEERRSGRGNHPMNAVCLIHNNLKAGTMYYFCVRAYNLAGDSETSDIVNCMTLGKGQTAMPVPEIVANQCRSYTGAIQIHSPSPCRQELGTTFYLLYREAAANKIWKSIALANRVDHRVFGLESDTMFDFVIMACNANGECQVSNMVTLRTERSAY